MANGYMFTNQNSGITGPIGPVSPLNYFYGVNPVGSYWSLNLGSSNAPVPFLGVTLGGTLQILFSSGISILPVGNSGPGIIINQVQTNSVFYITSTVLACQIGGTAMLLGLSATGTSTILGKAILNGWTGESKSAVLSTVYASGITGQISINVVGGNLGTGGTMLLGDVLNRAQIPSIQWEVVQLV